MDAAREVPLHCNGLEEVQVLTRWSSRLWQPCCCSGRGASHQAPIRRDSKKLEQGPVGPASRRATHTARCPVTKHQCGYLKKQKSLAQQMQKRPSHRKHEKMCVCVHRGFQVPLLILPNVCLSCIEVFDQKSCGMNVKERKSMWYPRKNPKHRSDITWNRFCSGQNKDNTMRQ